MNRYSDLLSSYPKVGKRIEKLIKYNKKMLYRDTSPLVVSFRQHEKSNQEISEKDSSNNKKLSFNEWLKTLKKPVIK